MDYNDEIHSDDWHTRETLDSSVSIKTISAKEANTKTLETISSCITNELSEIMNNIQNEINEGHFYYSGDGHLHEVTKKKLEELGYEVKIGSQYNEPYYSISWKNA